MKVKALQKAIKARKKDNGSDFAVGSVIRWVVVTSDNRQCIYCAVKTPIGWFTTAREGNVFVPQVVSYEGLVYRLSKEEVVEICFATDWEVVDV